MGGWVGRVMLWYVDGYVVDIGKCRFLLCVGGGGVG